MIKLATIGTSWITEQFIEACIAEGSYQLSKVYSRTLDKAQAVVDKYKQGKAVDDLADLYQADVDIIYIASPNALHYGHAIEALKHDKHVIVEKPQFANLNEWQDAHDLAREKDLYLFEAIRHIQNRNYKLLKSLLAQKLVDLDRPFLGAALNIGQYSSKYDAYVDAIEHQGNLPNIFNLEFATGTLMDIGVYPIYVAVDLFGMPDQIDYQPLKGPNGVDLMGTIIFTYDTFQVTIFISKAVHSTKPSEIYIGDETIVIPYISEMDRIDVVTRQNVCVQSYQYPELQPMYDEAKYFADILQGAETDYAYQDLEKLSQQVTRVMQDLREVADIEFIKRSH
ncbi:Gfo/Idh/MocA family protein [Ignavigranum ruoffiae]|uniref:Gfo/Idh/MocA family protein n=1 Tax=Ignavigranum ruoffiae TaxID=89093 RepID=UPI0024ADC664|nr:Gfo/Idh/MocA family oxidoreductase [Ignavigranum ruoffiae]